MSLSSDKNEKNGAARSARADGSQQNPAVERRLTAGLAHASRLAGMVARSRAARQVEVADMLAGMYIYEWERLSAFWGDHEAIEALLRKICSISPQRWNHWIELYDRQRREEQAEAASPWRRLMQRTRSAANENEPNTDNLPRSQELAKILRSAAEISPFRDELADHTVPVLTSETVLLCIARNEDSDLSHSLRQTGLDIPALERAARDPRRVPHS